MSSHLKKNLKAYTSLVGAVLTALSATYTHSVVLTLVLVVVTAVGTWAAKNDDAA